MFSANSSQVSEDRLYVEDVFSTYLYSGTSGAQSINNGIDTLNKGGLVWMKNRGSALSHILIDTAQGCTFAGGKNLISNSTNAAGTIAANTFQFDSTGFSFGSAASGGAINASGNTYVSWTFRKAPKFFDVVTWTGNNTARTISHNLGVAPGVIIVKAYSGTDASTANWAVYHRSLGNSNWLKLETTDAALTTGQFLWTSTAPTATEFSIAGGGITEVNKTGNTYVAYLFAHDTTSDGIIQCGSATCNSGGIATFNLGWEPQWILFKQANGIGDWRMMDNMRGWTNNSGGNQQGLLANSSAAEGSYGWTDTLSPTGGTIWGSSGDTFIYIAIRRGPMRTPTSGTSVFSPNLETANAPWFKSGFATDMGIYGQRTGPSSNKFYVGGRLTGTAVMNSRLTDAEFSDSSYKFDYMTGWNSNAFNDGSIWIGWSFRRAPSFFDEVCYTGTGVARTVNHNLGVAPEIIITKSRSNGALSWNTYVAPLGNTSALRLNTTDATLGGYWNSTSPTSSVFSLSSAQQVNENGGTYVAYLFASCPGVSKCGSYTGNGSSQTINCGFAAGARFILIKRTDSTGNWVTFDSARGIVSGNDPSLLLNSTAAETNYDDIDPDSSGFIVNQSTNNLNVSSAQYIYLAIS